MQQEKIKFSLWISKSKGIIMQMHFYIKEFTEDKSFSN